MFADGYRYIDTWTYCLYKVITTYVITCHNVFQLVVPKRTCHTSRCTAGAFASFSEGIDDKISWALTIKWVTQSWENYAAHGQNMVMVVPAKVYPFRVT